MMQRSAPLPLNGAASDGPAGYAVPAATWRARHRLLHGDSAQAAWRGLATERRPSGRMPKQCGPIIVAPPRAHAAPPRGSEARAEGGGSEHGREEGQ
jgi:hypothetical protein